MGEQTVARVIGRARVPAETSLAAVTIGGDGDED